MSNSCGTLQPKYIYVQPKYTFVENITCHSLQHPRNIDSRDHENLPFSEYHLSTFLSGYQSQIPTLSGQYLLKYILSNESTAEILLKNATYESAKYLFELLKQNFSIILEHSNYFCQRLIKLLSLKDRLVIWNMTKHNLDYMLTNKYTHHCYKLLIDFSEDQNSTNFFGL